MSEVSAFEAEVRVRLNTLENVASILIAKTLADESDADIADLHERIVESITRPPAGIDPAACANAVAALDEVFARVAAYRAR